MGDVSSAAFGDGQSFVVRFNGKLYVTHGSWEYDPVVGADTPPERRQTIDALHALLGSGDVAPVAVTVNDATIKGQIIHPGGPNLKLHSPQP